MYIDNSLIKYFAPEMEDEDEKQLQKEFNKEELDQGLLN